jgi:hypothetical protein
LLPIIAANGGFLVADCTAAHLRNSLTVVVKAGILGREGE